RTALLAVFYTGSIQRSPNNMVTNPWQIFYPSTPNQNNGVLLKIVSFARNIGNHFNFIGKTNFSHFTKCRVGLLWSGSINTGANTTALRASIQSTRLSLGVD